MGDEDNVRSEATVSTIGFVGLFGEHIVRDRLRLVKKLVLPANMRECVNVYIYVLFMCIRMYGWMDV